MSLYSEAASVNKEELIRTKQGWADSPLIGLLNASNFIVNSKTLMSADITGQ